MATTIIPVRRESDEYMALAFGRAFDKETKISIGGSSYNCLLPPKIYKVNLKDLNNADFEFVIQTLLVERDDGMIYEIRASNLANVFTVVQRAEKGVDLFSNAKLAKYDYCLAYSQELHHNRKALGIMEFDMDMSMRQMIDNLTGDIVKFIKGINGKIEEIILPE